VARFCHNALFEFPLNLFFPFLFLLYPATLGSDDSPVILNHFFKTPANCESSIVLLCRLLRNRRFLFPLQCGSKSFVFFFLHGITSPSPWRTPYSQIFISFRSNGKPRFPPSLFFVLPHLRLLPYPSYSPSRCCAVSLLVSFFVTSTTFYAGPKRACPAPQSLISSCPLPHPVSDRSPLPFPLPGQEVFYLFPEVPLSDRPLHTTPHFSLDACIVQRPVFSEALFPRIRPDFSPLLSILRFLKRGSFSFPASHIAPVFGALVLPASFTDSVFSPLFSMTFW